ncbi:YhdP family protein [Burkholderia sp. L27(2015)]|uniref:YhdP family phospholipid transporter n=1 Tax=Burkholderia sp. L27(2015) TaxID=1641858 RepID=UPI00131C812F|nr:AsmA-like C-terminal region-containing protein [Burkholderia sp. L27(2015)]
MPDRKDLIELPSVAAEPEPTDEISRALWRVLSERVLWRTLEFMIVLAIVMYFAVAVTALSLRFVVMPRIDSFRPAIEAAASNALHAQVSMQSISARWDGFAPRLELSGLTVRDPTGAPALTVPHASATLAWRSILRLTPVFARLEIQNPVVLATRRADGSIEVAGVQIKASGEHDDKLTHWLFTQGAVLIRGGTLTWRDNARGLPDLTLKNIKLAVFNFSLTHRIGLQADGDGTWLKGPLDFRARFRHGVLADPGAPASWNGRAYLSIGALDLPTLGRYVDLPIQASGGQMGGNLTLSFSKMNVNAVEGELNGDALALHVTPSLPEIDSPSLAMHFDLRHDGREYRLAVRDLSMALSDPKPLSDGTPLDRLLSLGQLDAVYLRPTVGKGQAFSLHGDQVDVGLLAEFSRKLPVPRTIEDQLQRYDPRGVLRNYTVKWERAAPATAADVAEAEVSRSVPIVSYQIDADLDNLGIAPQPPAPGLTPLGHPHVGQPGFENLSGHIYATEKGGSLALASQSASVTIEGLFDQPKIDLNTLSGHLDWALGKNGEQRTVKVHTDDLSVSNADATVHTRVTYAKTDSGPGSLDLLSNFSHLEVAAVPRYLPTSLSAKLRAYLEHALRGGTSTDASVEVSGLLENFPFDHPSRPGVFHIVAPFQDGIFDPTSVPTPLMSDGRPEQWPSIDGVAGRFEINREKLGFTIDRAHYRQFNLSHVEGRIANLSTRDDDLVIEGQGAGPMSDLLAFVNASPIALASGHITEKLSGQGETGLALKLGVSRDERKERTDVAGTLDLKNDTLSYGDLPPLTRLQGKVEFAADRTMTLQRLSGEFLGEPVRFDGGMTKDGTLAVNVDGSITADALRTELPNGMEGAVARRLSGTAPYRVVVHAAPHATADITASADLSAMAIDLPAPLGKAAGTPMPLRFSLISLSQAANVGSGGASVGASDGASVGTSIAGSTQPEADTIPPRAASKDDGPTVMKKAPIEQIDAQLGPVSLAYVLRNHPSADAEPTVLRGAIGVNKTVPLPARGVALEVDLDHLDLDAWRKTLSSLQPPEAKTRPTFPLSSSDPATDAPRPRMAGGYSPTTFKAHVGALNLFSRQWDNIALDGSHMNDQWQGDLQSDQVTGHALWRPHSPLSPAGELETHLSHVNIPPARTGAALMEGLRTERQQFPAINATVDDFTVSNRHFGKLELQARNLRQDGVPVWQLDSLKVTSPAATLTTTGSWRLPSGDAAAATATATATALNATNLNNPGSPASVAPSVFAVSSVLAESPAQVQDTPPAQDLRRTELDFKLDIADAGALLNQLGLPHTLQKGNGTLSGHIGWRGGPDAIDSTTLDGHLAAELKRGEFLKVDPGIAKLLGVFSLQSLSRFLTLDFRDIFGAGLPFDSITATSDVRRGIIHIDDFKLNSSPAKISMHGTADIPQETQDLRVMVVPVLSASSAALAATAINPVLGLGTFVAQLVLSNSLAQALSIEYAVTGSWAAPQIRKIKDRSKFFKNPLAKDTTPPASAPAH